MRMTTRFAQLYILDSDEDLDMRMAIKENNKCDPELMDNLDSFIRREHNYAKAYKIMNLRLEKNIKQTKKAEVSN